MTDRSTRKFKIVLLGEGRVGKTSILLRYIKGEYDDKQVSTLQASYLDKKMVLEGKKVQLSLWDTAGQERFHALGPIYYRDADGALLVYDVTDDESFRKIRTWVRELRRIVGEDLALVIAGNKSDLTRNRKVDEEEAKQYAESVGASHFLTSAKMNKNLEEVFVDITKQLLHQKTSKSTKKSKKTSTLIADDEDETPPRPPPSDYRKASALTPTSASKPQSRHRRTASSGARAMPSSNSRAPASGSTRATSTSEAESAPKPAKKNLIQLSDDDVDELASSRISPANLRIRGGPSQVDPAKQKSGCC